jgi:hypothetical protein
MEVSPKAAADRAPEALQADRQAAEVLDQTARRAAALQAHDQPPLLVPGDDEGGPALLPPPARPPAPLPPFPPSPLPRPAMQLSCGR